MFGQAGDIEVRGVPNFDLASWIFEDLGFDQLILEFYRSGRPESGWVHCLIRRSGGNRREAKTFNGTEFQDALVA